MMDSQNQSQGGIQPRHSDVRAEPSVAGAGPRNYPTPESGIDAVKMPVPVSRIRCPAEFCEPFPGCDTSLAKPANQISERSVSIDSQDMHCQKMKHAFTFFLCLLQVPILFSPAARGADPSAQDYVVVHKVRDLDHPAKAVCVGTPDILVLPSGRLIASMELWLKRPTSGDEGGIDYPNHCKIKASDDDGRTWQQISTNGITWGSLFYANRALHMIGNDPLKRDIRIVRSNDDGKTWSTPVTLFDDSRYHGSATPVHVKNGFIYRAFEDMDRGSASLVLAGDLSKDLLDPTAWRMSNKIEPPRDTPSLTRTSYT